MTFVRTASGSYSNLARAAAIVPRRDRDNPDEFVVIAVFSGREVLLDHSLPSMLAAEASAARYAAIAGEAS